MSIARRGLMDATIQTTIILVSLVTGILVSRGLGPEGRGLFMLGTVIAGQMMVAIGNVGLGSACRVLVARDPSRLAEIHGMAVILAACLGGFGGLVLLMAWPWIGSSVFNGLPVGIAFLFLLFWPVMLYGAAWRGLQIGLGRIRVYGLTDLGIIVVQAAVLAFLLLVARGAAIEVFIVSYILVAILGAGAMSLLLPSGMRRFKHPRNDVARAFLKHGGWVYVGDLAGQARVLIDQLIVNSAGGAAALGLYNQASSLASRVRLPAQSLTTAAYQPITASPREEAQRLVAASVRQLVLLSLVLYPLAWFAALLIPLIYGSEFRPSIAPFRVLVVAFFLLGMARPLAAWFTGHCNRPRTAALINMISVAAQIVLSLALIPKLGILAAVTLGTTLAAVITFALFLALFRREHGAPTLPEILVPRGADLAHWARLLKRQPRSG